MKGLYKLLKQDPDSREGIITVTSALGIAANVLIAAVKILIGVLASSIAFVSEGVNNAADALSAVLTLLGARLAGKHPDEKHPFGYGRVEYLTGLLIAGLILATGIEMLKGGVERIFAPEELQVSLLSLIIIAGTAVVKFFLGVYTIRMGKKADSASLVGVGTECRSDAFASAISIVTAAVFLIWHISLDAYAGILISLLIIKAGGELLWETIADILGKPCTRELADELYREILKTEGVLNAADMMLHNYGPDAYSGSVNVEMDHRLSVGEAYRVLHDLQLRIMHEKQVTMVFGLYAVDADSDRSRAIRKAAGSFVQSQEHVKSFHAVYVDEKAARIYCDLVVDYRLRDWDELRQSYADYLKENFPEYDSEITIETEFV